MQCIQKQCEKLIYMHTLPLDQTNLAFHPLAFQKISNFNSQTLNNCSKELLRESDVDLLGVDPRARAAFDDAVVAARTNAARRHLLTGHPRF